ncbi:MarR family winged helix-turn-helix transcriptional regulator [Paenibacillus psychroresistens]|nr:MarR family transcriptional regulator [Paenibacillus psychroresistens]
MNAKEALRLDNQLCFTVYACSRAMTQLYRPWFEEIGITYPQYLVLLVLWEQDGVTVKDLGERLFLDSGTLTPLLKRMETAKLVTRKRSTDDERKVFIHLAEAGKQLEAQACIIPGEMMSQRGLNAEEFTTLLADFKGLLAKLHQSLDQKN